MDDGSLNLHVRLFLHPSFHRRLRSTRLPVNSLIHDSIFVYYLFCSRVLRVCRAIYDLLRHVPSMHTDSERLHLGVLQHCGDDHGGSNSDKFRPRRFRSIPALLHTHIATKVV